MACEDLQRRQVSNSISLNGISVTLRVFRQILGLPPLVTSFLEVLVFISFVEVLDVAIPVSELELSARKRVTYASLRTAISTGTSPGCRAIVTESKDTRVDRTKVDRMVGGVQWFL